MTFPTSKLSIVCTSAFDNRLITGALSESYCQFVLNGMTYSDSKTYTSYTGRLTYINIIATGY